MASWTDKPINFNPYVQQLPVEAMVSVGTQKQGLYNQGLQRIQSQIDSVAGLDIARDVDKAYLQSKMNSLGDNLKLVAAGDFSDFQLTNSVGGMINQVGKDENIQNAVASTRKFKRGMSDMQEAIKEGKSSSSNEHYFKNGANDWFNNPEVGASFNGEYMPYEDYRKYELEVLKSITGDSTITEDMIGPNGQILDAKVRNKLKGVSPNDIKNALMATLSPKHMKQMEIDGLYSYANMDDNTFASAIGLRHKSTFEAYNKKKESLTSKMNSTADGPEKALMKSRIAEIDKALDKINNEYKTVSEKIENGEIEAAKANLYTIDHINDFANAFSYTESELTYSANPMELALSRRQKLAAKSAKVSKTDDAMFGPMLGGLNREEQEAMNITMPRFTETVASLGTTLDEMDGKLVNEFGETENPEWINKQYELWRDSNANLDPKIKDHFEQTNELRKNLDMWRSLAVKIDEEAKGIYGEIKDYLPSENLSIQYRDINGGVNSITFDEVTSLNAKLGSETLAFMTANPMSPSQYIGEYFNDDVRNKLNDKEKVIYDGIVKNYMESTGPTAVANYMVKVNKTLKHNPKVKEIHEYKSQRITDVLLAHQSLQHDINITDKVNESAFKCGITGMIEDAKQQEGGMANSPEFSAKLAQNIIDSSNLNASIKVIPGTEFNEPLYKVTISADGESTSFNMNPERYQRFMKGRFDIPIENKQLNRYETMMSINKSNTTSYDGKKTNKGNAYLDKTDFRRIKYYGITGDLNKTTSGRYSVRLNITNPITGEILEDVPYVLPGYDKELFDKTEVIAAINSLTDDVIFQLLSENHEAPTPEEMEEIKANALKVYK